MQKPKFNNEGRELALYIENERNLYDRMHAFQVNYTKKAKKGIYNKALAFKGIRENLIPDAAKQYCAEFGGVASHVFNKEARDFAAYEILESIEDAMFYQSEI